jgi:hypothetical protein
MAYPDVKVEIKGIQEVNAALKAYGKDLGRGLELALNRTALVALTDVRNAIENSPKSGTTYYRIPGAKYMTIRAGSADGPPVAFIPGGGKRNLSLTHRASAAGEPPASDTGALVTSMYIENRGKYGRAIGSRLPYAYHLEFGTRDGKLGKRPAWVPAVQRAMPRLLELVQIAIAKAKARAEKTTK